MLTIGITGPTGAGKTTVLNVLRDLDAVVLDCDELYHELTESCHPMREELSGRFGPEIFDEFGALRRKVLGAMVFGDEAALADLNGITHRYIAQAVKEEITRARQQGRPAVAIDAIALLEGGLGALCDVTVAVTADDELRIRRIMLRDGISEAYARSRVEAQKPSAWFEAHCDHTLRNDGNDPEDLRQRAFALFVPMLKTHKEEL